jgi:hypothetical protein
MIPSGVRADKKRPASGSNNENEIYKNLRIEYSNMSSY